MLKIILGFDSIPGGRRSTGQRQIAIETGLGMGGWVELSGRVRLTPEPCHFEWPGDRDVPALGRTGPVLGRRNFCETICYGFPLMVLCKK
jgi:hypothetical protein